MIRSSDDNDYVKDVKYVKGNSGTTELMETDGCLRKQCESHDFTNTEQFRGWALTKDKKSCLTEATFTLPMQ